MKDNRVRIIQLSRFFSSGNKTTRTKGEKENEKEMVDRWRNNYLDI